MGMIMKLDRINIGEAFRYLGYGQNTPEDNVVSIAKECERQLLDVIEGRYVYRYFLIARCTAERVELEGTKLCFVGKSVAEHLNGCSGAVMLAATISEGADKLIRSLQVRRMSAAVIADSMASAAIEQVCDAAEREIMAGFPGKYATWRFSPGYGDFPLEMQKDFLEVLSAQKRIGIGITAGGLMTPCKSVTAVIGISDSELERKRRGCAVCGMRKRCGFQRKGEHCGI